MSQFVAARGSRLPSAPAASRRSVTKLSVPVLSGALLITGLGTGTAAAAPSAAAPAAAVDSAVRASFATFGYGSRSARVLWVQKRLGVRPLSGWYGPITTAAVKRFQRSHGLRATGSVGPKTWAALHRSSGSSGSSSSVISIAASVARGAYYVYGGTGPRGFDCSGYVQYVMRKAGKSLPRTAAAQRAATSRVSSPRPGDLVFVHSSSGHVYHAGIYAGGGYWYDAENPRTYVGKHRAWSRSVSYGRA